ncbi:uncharacterized protein LOC117785792 [Drosophila innubila]|uniref:uncharacterized protein LOC117785792 n=1 Tax=Drosophila innubila TaxID=198719 RepID=UPI00148BFE61|nr:uncharacterized protein LOC117785792 [Drosophila innubila]
MEPAKTVEDQNSTDLVGWRRSVVCFFNLPAVQCAQVILVVVGDILALSNFYPSHSMHISRPFLLWRR